MAGFIFFFSLASGQTLLEREQHVHNFKDTHPRTFGVGVGGYWTRPGAGVRMGPCET